MIETLMLIFDSIVHFILAPIGAAAILIFISGLKREGGQ